MCLDIRLDKLGTDHPDVANTYNNMAVVYRAQGDYPRALKYLKMCLDIRLDRLGTDHPDAANTYNNMAA
jgi:tetratricopeptide (TPR) repeat protein